MIIEEAVKHWALKEIYDTLGCMNDYLDEVEQPYELLDQKTLSIDFLLSEKLFCEEDCKDPECGDCLPSMPVLRVSAYTQSGRLIIRNKTLHDIKMEELLATVCKSAGGKLELGVDENE